MNDMKNLDAVLAQFAELAKIPRPSHHEEQVSSYLFNWALEHGLYVERDEMGEIIIDKPASEGCESVPRTIMQAHMDMVCVAAEGVKYDPLNDPVRLVREGDILRADGTSLGADQRHRRRNGAVRACGRHAPPRPAARRVYGQRGGRDGLHGHSSRVPRGRISHKPGLGDPGLAVQFLRRGDYFNFSRDAQWEDTPKRSVAIELGLAGFLGGHSGVGIHLGHANALVSAATALEYLRQNDVEFRVASFTGGQAKNAIPASANAVITLTVAQAQRAMELLDAFKAEFYGGYRDVEPSGVFTASLTSAPERVMGETAGYSLIGLMSSVPNDVFTMSPFVPGLVESSANLGVISLDGASASRCLPAAPVPTGPCRPA